MTGRFQVIGHRGAMGNAPENTLAGVRKAVALGADGVEVDVRWVAGRVMVFHDETLERTTDGAGEIAGLTFEELRGLDAGGGEKIPTLEEVVAEVGGDAFVNIELKTPGTPIPVCDLIRQWIGSGKVKMDRFLVSSFFYELLAEIDDSDVRIGCLFGGDGWERCRLAAMRLKAFSVHPHVPCVTREMVREAHAEGWKVFPFTVNSLEEAGRLKEWGADGVFTDFPERLLELRTERRDR